MSRRALTRMWAVWWGEKRLEDEGKRMRNGAARRDIARRRGVYFARGSDVNQVEGVVVFSVQKEG